MPRTVADLDAVALRLGADERTHLVDRLLAGLPVDPDVAHDGSAEALRRARELESGAAEAVPLDDAVSRAWAVMR
ncbi:MAG: addiction module protein [Gammaproteobacteria bacterium]|uniref:addiction module protein n=1 Tax=Azohydromonas sp. TaxID=1872666 RepID=UPI002CBD1E90|nr:addiction module protein [Azohydromonas sp.]HMM87105.1 addiction module protein [Azohydromonas sp.]